MRWSPAGCRTCRFRSAATTRCARPFTPCSCTTPYRPHGHGHRQRRGAAVYEDIPAELRERVEDVVLNRRADAAERLIEIAPKYAGKGEAAKGRTWRGARSR